MHTYILKYTHTSYIHTYIKQNKEPPESGL